VGGDPLGTSATVEPRLGLGWYISATAPVGPTEQAALAPSPRRGDRLPPVRLVWVLAHAIASKTPALGGVNDQIGFWRSDAEGRT
jgi:hypothetical protein